MGLLVAYYFMFDEIPESQMSQSQNFLPRFILEAMENYQPKTKIHDYIIKHYLPLGEVCRYFNNFEKAEN